MEASLPCSIEIAWWNSEIVLCKLGKTRNDVFMEGTYPVGIDVSVDICLKLSSQLF